jgi:hypothetical protein
MIGQPYQRAFFSATPRGGLAYGQQPRTQYSPARRPLSSGVILCRTFRPRLHGRVLRAQRSTAAGHHRQHAAAPLDAALAVPDEPDSPAQQAKLVARGASTTLSLSAWTMASAVYRSNSGMIMLAVAI